MLTPLEIKKLEEMANTMRQDLISMLVKAGSGHTAGPLGMADIFAAFYFHILQHNPKNPFWEDRDRLILSNGHICPIRYVAMARSGYFPLEELNTLRKFGTRLQGHPEREKLPGVETTSGPLGSGLGQASGIAYAARMDNKKFRVYCLMSDGEQDAGNTWEAAMFAGKNKLHNVTAVMDRNNIQIDGMTEDIMPLESVRAKYEAFNWHVIETDGNNIGEFINATEQAKAIFEKPTIIITHNIPGKGIKEIEFDYRWHGSPPGQGPEDVWPKNKQGEMMLKELRTLNGKITSEHE
jgi:transketolase